MAKIATSWDAIKNILLSKRFTSFYWRLGMMVLATIIGALLANLDLLTPYVSPATIGVLGLILGEISKGIANALKEVK